MTDKVMDTDALPSFLLTILNTGKVRVSENNRVITIEPVEEKNDCTIGLRGILSGYPEMSVEKFLERKYTEWRNFTYL